MKKKKEPSTKNSEKNTNKPFPRLSSFTEIDGIMTSGCMYSVDEVIERLQEIKKKYKNRNISIQIESDTYSYAGLNVYELKLETQEAFDKRIKKFENSQKKIKKRQEEYDRKEFERLKKKFEGADCI